MQAGHDFYSQQPGSKSSASQRRCGVFKVMCNVLCAHQAQFQLCAEGDKLTERGVRAAAWHEGEGRDRRVETLVADVNLFEGWKGEWRAV